MGNQQAMRSFKVAELPDLAPGSRDALDRPEVRYWIGSAYLNKGMLDDALSQFQQALQLDPEHAGSLLGAARAQLGLRRPAEALGLAKRAIVRERLNAEAFYLAGLASQALNASTEAGAFFERAANLEPHNARFRKALGRAGGDSGSVHLSTGLTGAPQ